MSEIGIEMSEILHQHIIHNNNNIVYLLINKAQKEITLISHAELI